MTQAGGWAASESALQRVANELEKDASLRRQVKSATVYPTPVTTSRSGSCSRRAPSGSECSSVCSRNSGANPAITKISVFMSKVVTGYWWAMFIGTAVLAVAFVKWKKSSWGRKQWDHFRLHIPMKIGTIVQQVAVARWSRTLASLTSAGVPLLQALEITGRTGGNIAVEEAMDGVIASVKRGGTIAAPLAQAPIFPSMVTHMVGVGEETGALDAMLDKVAEFYEDQVEASVKALTSIMEPVMIMVIGGMVGFIVISMYLPLFEVYNHIE